ncbi:hypothetical protein D3C72_1735650 [compost metagenome]
MPASEARPMLESSRNEARIMASTAARMIDSAKCTVPADSTIVQLKASAEASASRPRMMAATIFTVPQAPW